MGSKSTDMTDSRALGDADAAEGNTKREKGKGKSKIRASKQRPVGSVRGVETMFRNAYRAELEMITLAATKANIMISLNGFIASALVISGAFIYTSSPEFLVPATFFLFTSAASIYFALLAASPDLADRPPGIFSWLKAVLKREASLRDFNAYVRRRRDFVDGESNILIYEERVKLSKAAYWERMRALLSDQEDVYAKMSDQLYWLGQMANRKFKLLKTSYSIFRWGLILSVLSFIAVESFDAIRLAFDSEPVGRLRNVDVWQFDDVYEPSAVQQLPDGRILVAEDEPDRALSILRFRADGSLASDPALDAQVMSAFPTRPNDLEGVSMDADGYIYAITSHSKNRKGRRDGSREQLLRFRVVGDDVVDLQVYTGLIAELQGSAVIQQALSRYTDQPVNLSDSNIEGLGFDQSYQRLLIGFREPVVEGKSMIVKLDNPDGIFDRGETPNLSEVVLLDLQGGGIRSLTYDPVLGSFLIANEISGHDGNMYSQLWSWSGQSDAQPEPVALPKTINLVNLEAIDSVTVNAEPRLLLMSDDGSVKKGQPAKYALLNYGQLSAE